MNLKDMNTLGVDVFASKYFLIKEREQIPQVLKDNKDFIVLGGGSNICFSREKILKPILKIDIKGTEKKDSLLIASAGENWDEFVKVAIKEGVSNIENLSGIPGSVGASPIQNIGAYGVEVSDLIEWVEFFNPKTGEFDKFDNTDCQFAYRDSIFKREKFIITRVAFQIKERDVCIDYKDLQEYFGGKKPKKEDIRKAVLEIRSRKFPDLSIFGTAGSFFKNPIVSTKKHEELVGIYPDMPAYDMPFNKKKIPLAWILDKVCNLKGYREGNVWLYEKQPLILVTNKQATPDEIKNFSDKIKKIVFEKTKIKIQNEVVFKK